MTKTHDRSDKNQSFQTTQNLGILDLSKHPGTVFGRHEGLGRRHRAQGRTEAPTQVEGTAIEEVAASIADLPWSTGSLAQSS